MGSFPPNNLFQCIGKQTLEYHRQFLKDLLVPGQSSGRRGEALLDHTACVMNCIWFYGFPKSCPKRRLVVFLVRPPPLSFFLQGVSAILACVFPHLADPGQGGICQEGKQLPKAVTRAQSSPVQFGVVGLLLTSVFWAPYSHPPFKILFHPPLFLYYCSSWICLSTVVTPMQNSFFWDGSSMDISEALEKISNQEPDMQAVPSETTHQLQPLGEETSFMRSRRSIKPMQDLPPEWVSVVGCH